jgi:hypothetical protein
MVSETFKMGFLLFASFYVVLSLVGHALRWSIYRNTVTIRVIIDNEGELWRACPVNARSVSLGSTPAEALAKALEKLAVQTRWTDSITVATDDRVK